MSELDKFQFEAIGIVRSPFREKFGIPRQPGLATSAESTLELLPPYNRQEAVNGLEGFSHIWIIFIFHGVKREEWKPTVRPPRLGGNQRIGVFASRSTHRPNQIGLSVVELARIECSEGRVVLHLKGADLLDGTPVFDIKPYIPYVDSVPDAEAGFAGEAPQPHLRVYFSDAAMKSCQQLAQRYPRLQSLIKEIIAYDPRPAYQAKGGKRREYGVTLYGLNIRFVVEGVEAEVLAIEGGNGREKLGGL